MSVLGWLWLTLSTDVPVQGHGDLRVQIYIDIDLVSVIPWCVEIILTTSLSHSRTHTHTHTCTRVHTHAHTHTHSSRVRLDALVSLNKVLSFKMVAHHLLGRSVSLATTTLCLANKEMLFMKVIIYVWNVYWGQFWLYVTSCYVYFEPTGFYANW